VELQLSHLPAVDVFNVDLLISKLQMLISDTVKDEDAGDVSFYKNPGKYS